MEASSFTKEANHALEGTSLKPLEEDDEDDEDADETEEAEEEDVPGSVLRLPPPPPPLDAVEDVDALRERVTLVVLERPSTGSV